MLKKRLRMELDFEVEVEELTEESLRRYYAQFPGFERTAADGETWGNIMRQIPLHLALLEDEVTLGRYLTHVVVTEVDDCVDGRLGEVFGVGGERAEDEIFGPLFSRLNEEDAQYFLQASADGDLFEAVEALARCYKGRLTGAVLSERTVVLEGDVDRQ